jgi:hypothetical protein
MAKRFIIDIGGYTLDIVTDVTQEEMDDRFIGICQDTGETLAINGWLIDDIEEI